MLACDHTQEPEAEPRPAGSLGTVQVTGDLHAHGYFFADRMEVALQAGTPMPSLFIVLRMHDAHARILHSYTHLIPVLVLV